MSVLGAVVRGYQKLAREQVDEWTTYARAVNKKVNAGAYDSDKLVADAVEGVRLTGWTWFSVVSETLDAISILSKAPDGAPLVFGPFTSPLAGASLVITEDIMNDNGRVIPAEMLRCVPVPLAAGETQFHIHLTRGPWASGVYETKVTGSTPTAAGLSFTIEIGLA